MKSPLLIASSLAAAATAFGAEDVLEYGRNRVLLSGHLGFNFKTAFGYAEPLKFDGLAGQAVSGVDHVYADGYVKRDVSGSSGSTWNWGYSAAGQLDATKDTLALHSFTGDINAPTRSTSPDALPVGGEAGYEHFFGKIGNVAWGIHASVGFTSFNVNDRTVLLSNPVGVQTDTYSLGGIVPPTPGYEGTFNGPGALLQDTPTRVESQGQVATIGVLGNAAPRVLDATFIGLKLGPVFEIPIGRKIAASATAGLAGAYIDGSFKVRESYFFNSSVFGTRIGSISDSDFKMGGYIQGRIGMRGNGVFAGFEYQYLPDYQIGVAGRTAKVALGEGVYVFGGVGFSF